jgi:hypothetical protein
MKRALIVVEGQTEERFVKDVLQPALTVLDFFITPIIVTTKIVKDGPNFKGGLCNFAKFRGDVQRVLQGSGGAMVTTMIDYYALPDDFPGMDTRPKNASSLQRVLHVEHALRESFAQHQNFLPFIALHEYEAWLFSDPSVIPETMIAPETQAQFAAIAQIPPEEINDHPDTAPSKRLLRLYPGYRKAIHGPLVAGRIGLAAIRARCPHFADWVGRLEAHASDNE